MRIVSIDELEVNDRVVIQTSAEKVEIVTVKTIDVDDCLLVFKEHAPFDYTPDDSNAIVVMDDDGDWE